MEHGQSVHVLSCSTILYIIIHTMFLLLYILVLLVSLISFILLVVVVWMISMILKFLNSTLTSAINDSACQSTV